MESALAGDVRTRGHAHDSPELLSEVATVIEADIEGGGGDVGVWLGEEFGGAFDTEAEEVGAGRAPCSSFERTAEGTGAHTGDAGQVVKRLRFSVMIFEIADDFADADEGITVARVGGGVVATEGDDDDFDEGLDDEMSAGEIRLKLLFEELEEVHEVIKLLGGEVEFCLEAVGLTGMGFEDKEGVEAGEVTAFMFESGEAVAFNKEIDEAQALDVTEGVDVFATDDEGVAAEEGVFFVINDVHARAAGDDNDLIEGMAMRGGSILFVHALNGKIVLGEIRFFGERWRDRGGCSERSTAATLRLHTVSIAQGVLRRQTAAYCA